MNYYITATEFCYDGEIYPNRMWRSATGRTIYSEIEFAGEVWRYSAWDSKWEDNTDYKVFESVYRGNVVELEMEYAADLLASYESMTAKAAEKAARKSTDPAKQRRGEVPAKDFIGESIRIPYGVINFDATANKTMITLDKKAPRKVKEIVEAAGFYHNYTTGTYNKKLTFKARRAALALHDQLWAPYKGREVGAPDPYAI